MYILKAEGLCRVGVIKCRFHTIMYILKPATLVADEIAYLFPYNNVYFKGKKQPSHLYQTNQFPYNNVYFKVVVWEEHGHVQRLFPYNNVYFKGSKHTETTDPYYVFPYNNVYFKETLQKSLVKTKQSFHTIMYILKMFFFVFDIIFEEVSIQ